MTLLYACTTNAGKLREFLHAAAEPGIHDFAIEALPGIRDIAPPEENGRSFEENSILKAVYYSQLTGDLVFADEPDAPPEDIAELTEYERAGASRPFPFQFRHRSARV